MTIKELKQHIEELESKHGEDCHVFQAEGFMAGNTVHTQIRDFEKSDINFYRDISDTAGFPYSQFNEGVVIGFVPTVDS